MHSLYKRLLSIHCVLSTVLVLGIQERTGQMPALEETQRERLIREPDTVGWGGTRGGHTGQAPPVCGVSTLDQGPCPTPTARHQGSWTEKA